MITWSLKDELIQQEILHSDLKRKRELLVQEFTKYKESAHKEIKEVEMELKEEVNENSEQLKSYEVYNDKLKKDIAEMEEQITKLKNTQSKTTNEHNNSDTKCT